MFRAMWASATGMRAQQTNIDVIANNMANVNTTGFKRSQATFQDMIYDRIRDPGSAGNEGSGVPVGIQLGLGTQVSTVSKVFTEGKPQQTSRELDVMIQGPGFFAITLPDSTAYTRDGSFHISSDGTVVTAEGYTVEGFGTINPQATAISISSNGTVSEIVAGVATTTGNLQLHNFLNPSGLIPVGENLFIPSSSSGSATAGTPGSSGFGNLEQGFLEMSNVEVVQEMVNMIMAQRAYEVNTKAIQASDEMLQAANNIRR